MTDRPILFSKPMILALLAGTKTQTRRAINGIEIDKRVNPNFTQLEAVRETTGKWRIYGTEPASNFFNVRFEKGDRLWAKETWRSSAAYADLKPSIIPNGAFFYYEADQRGTSALTLWDHKKRPAIFMPRQASRLTLHVTEVRVTRLTRISSADAIAEGCAPHANSLTIDCDTTDPRDDYKRLWDSINGAGSWDKNPWVVAVSFEVEKVNIDRARAAA